MSRIKICENCGKDTRNHFVTICPKHLHDLLQSAKAVEQPIDCRKIIAELEDAKGDQNITDDKLVWYRQAFDAAIRIVKEHVSVPQAPSDDVLQIAIQDGQRAKEECLRLQNLLAKTPSEELVECIAKKIVNVCSVDNIVEWESTVREIIAAIEVERKG